MSRQNNNPWDEKWEIIKSLSKGGQGETSLIKPRHPVDSSECYVLKQLHKHKQKNPKSRKRMYREVAALKTVDCPGISKLVDSNADQFASNVPLYMVTEFIPGKTLQDFLNSENLNIVEAASLVLKVLDSLEKCHQDDIVHRDIKPQNIIIRNNNIEAPVLIDFGISFTKSDSEDTDLTESWEQVGNRFLTLPEQQSQSSLQRDPRSDITQCCGILFFALTKLSPINLFDHEERKPHQRPDSKQALSQFDSYLLAKVNIIFDRAFELKIDNRWQSIPPLKEALMQLLQPVQSASTNDSASYIDRIHKKLSNDPDYVMRQSFQTLANQIVQEIHKVGSSVASELGSDFGIIIEGGSYFGRNLDQYKAKINCSKLIFYEKYGITNKFLTESFFPEFKGIATGNELVLLAEFQNQETELLRVALNGELDLTEFSKRLKNFYMEGVLKIVEGEAGK